jgi:hypothetical protein
MNSTCKSRHAAYYYQVHPRNLHSIFPYIRTNIPSKGSFQFPYYNLKNGIIPGMKVTGGRPMIVLGGDNEKESWVPWG